MAGDLVLITGGSGHVGFRVLRQALESGYQVRAAVRGQAKADRIKNNAALQATNKVDQLSFVIVRDFTVPNAFDEAAAAPADGDYKRGFIDPAVNMTINMFEAAKKAGTVERIVVTSSVVALQGVPGMVSETGITYTAEDRIADMTEYDNPVVAYIASKIAALNHAEAWVKEHKPAFDVVHIPSLPPSIPLPAITNNWNHVDDNARIHVESLQPRVKGNQSFIVSTDGQDGMRWEDVKEIVQKHFKKEIESGILPNNGTLGSLVSKLDTSKTVETFGPLEKTFEDAVVGAVGQWLELQAKQVAVSA